MADSTTDFFEDLARRGHEPLLEQATGRIAVEVVGPRQTERWLVEVDGGDVAVSRENGDSDCTVRTSEELFDGIVRGEVNVMAGFLRGDIEVEGDPELLVLFQRIFPGPPGDGGSGRDATRGGRSQR
jgi:predicted lipid carrier protein YhbT